MNRRQQGWMVLMVLVAAMAMTTACSMNRQTPKELDKAAMEGDIRAAIAAAVPGKTFALQVDVRDNGRVALSGNVDSATDRNAIVAKVRQVNGVRSVDSSGIHVQ